mmetsp:Transcript_57412/g.101881  ORF Transcript_57412/g.101881 Transcript_57412/m.101881 type:complete len:381 (+) Transcript_57412:378-1520(+)
MDCFGSLTALCDSPNDQGLPTAAVSCCKDLGVRSAEITRLCRISKGSLEVAPLHLHAELFCKRALWAQETQGQEDQVCLENSFTSSDFLHLHATIVVCPLKVNNLATCDATMSIADELFGLHAEGANVLATIKQLCSFLVAVVRAKLVRPVGPWSVISSRRRRLWEKLQIMDGFGSMTNGGANAVIACVTSANDDYVLAMSIQGWLAFAVACWSPTAVHAAAVQQRLCITVEEVHGQMHSFQVPTRNALHVPTHGSSSCQKNGVVAVQQLLSCWSTLLSDSPCFAANKNNAFLLHDPGSLTYHIMLVSLHVGHAIHHQTARPIGTLVHSDEVAHLVQLVCSCKSSRARADDGNSLAGAQGRWAWRHPAILVGLVNNKELN